MKSLQLAAFMAMSTLLPSCNESPNSAASRNRAEAKIKEAAESVGYAEHSLSTETEPGAAALKTEKLREAKARLSTVIDENSKILADSRQLADSHLATVKAELANADLQVQQKKSDAEKEEAEAYDRIRAMNERTTKDQAPREDP